jgi:hypothetical protein
MIRRGVQSHKWDSFTSFQREHAPAQTDRAWQRCAVVSMPLGRVVTGTVIDQQPFGVFLDLGEPFIALLQCPSYPPEFDASADEHPPLGSTVRAIVVGHASKQLDVSAKPEVIATADRLRALTLFALVSAEDGQDFVWFPGFEKRDWLPGDTFPWGPFGGSLRVVRMIEPERNDELPVLIVESGEENEPSSHLAGPLLGRLPG